MPTDFKAHPEKYELKKQKERERWVKWNKKNPGVAAKRMTEWKRKNPERHKVLLRRALLKKYGLTIDSFEALLIQQGGRCKLCRKARLPTEREWQVDHCHRTGNVRGILCYNCNVGLGHFKDSTDLLSAAITYLEENNG